MRTMRTRLLFLVICGVAGAAWAYWPYHDRITCKSSFGLTVEARQRDPRAAARDEKSLEVISAFYEYCLAENATADCDVTWVKLNSMLSPWEDTPSPTVEFALSGPEESEVKNRARRLRDTLDGVVTHFSEEHPQYSAYPIVVAADQDVRWHSRPWSWQSLIRVLIAGVTQGMVWGLVVIQIVSWKGAANNRMQATAGAAPDA